MKLPLSWFKDFVDISLPAEKLAEELTLSGTKIDSLELAGKDTIYDFEITPNRADLFSVYGIAREISALTEEDLKPLETQLPYLENRKEDKLTLTVKDKGLILGYALAVFDNVQIGDSPDYIKDRLQKSGIRALNNVIDTTNYVMLETGQPSHAFDYDKIRNAKMTLRASTKGEKVTTLDGVERALPVGSIVIEDSEKLIDLAGLMGGENSAIDAATKKVGLLVPIYHPVTIRRTSLALGLRTEASGRFEKNLDILQIHDTFYRLAKILFETSQARLSSEPTFYQEKEVELKTLELTLTDMEEFLGITLQPEKMVTILTSLGFLVKHLPQEGDRFAVTAPSWRTDIEIGVDVIEEVARLYGFNKFPKTLPQGQTPTHPDSFNPDWERLYKTHLISSGLTETYSYTLLPEKSVTNAGFDKSQVLKIINPNSLDFEYLRPTLLIGLLNAVALNLKNYSHVGLFEIGKVFSAKEKSLPSQDREVVLVTNQSFAYLKGVLDSLAQKFELELVYKKDSSDGFIDSRTASIWLGKNRVGEIGYLDSTLLHRFDIEVPVVAARVDFEKLIGSSSTEGSYHPLPKFPEVKEDLSIIVNQEVETLQVQKAIEKTGKPLLKRVVPFDYFISPKLGENKKSLTFSLTFGANKTLTGEEVAKVREKIGKDLKKTFKAEIR